MEQERAEIAEEKEELAFYHSAKKLATAITMLSVLQNPNWRPDPALTAINHAQPPPATRRVAASSLPCSIFRDGSKGLVVAAPLPPAHPSASHPFSDYTPLAAPSAWADTVPAFAPLSPPRRIPVPFNGIPLPTITALPFPVPPPESTFALTPRHLLPWPKAMMPLTQETVDSVWNTVHQTMRDVTAQKRNEPPPSIPQLVQRAIRTIEPWCPKAKSPADQVEAAKARAAAGGKVAKVNGAKPSPRIPVVPLAEGGARTPKTPMVGQVSPRLAPTL